jgi:hypothetical protein
MNFGSFDYSARSRVLCSVTFAVTRANSSDTLEHFTQVLIFVEIAGWWSYSVDWWRPCIFHTDWNFPPKLYISELCLHGSPTSFSELDSFSWHPPKTNLNGRGVLEVYQITGRTISEICRHGGHRLNSEIKVLRKSPPLFNVYNFCIRGSGSPRLPLHRKWGLNRGFLFKKSKMFIPWITRLWTTSAANDSNPLNIFLLGILSRAAGNALGPTAYKAVQLTTHSCHCFQWRRLSLASKSRHHVALNVRPSV